MTLVYCPGHVQIEGNEEADKEAKKAAESAPEDPAQDPTPIPHSVAVAVLKHYYRAEQHAEWCHSDNGHWAKVCTVPPRWKDQEGATRAEERILAQFRAGKCSLLADYRHMNGWEESPACECGAPVQDVEHVVLHCVSGNHVPARNRLFEPPAKIGVEVLARFPKRAVRFLRDIGMNAFKKKEPAAQGAVEVNPGRQSAVARGWATRKLKEAENPQKCPVKNPRKRPGYENKPNTNIKGQAFRDKLAKREQARLERAQKQGSEGGAQSGGPSTSEPAGGGQSAAGGGGGPPAPPPGQAEEQKKADGGSPRAAKKPPRPPHTPH